MSSNAKKLRTALHGALFRADSWRVSTWLLPMLFQIALGVFIAVSWLLMNFFSGLGSIQNVFLLSTIITTAVSAMLASRLMKSNSSRSRSIGLSAAGSAAAIFVGGIAFTIGITMLWRH